MRSSYAEQNSKGRDATPVAGSFDSAQTELTGSMSLADEQTVVGAQKVLEQSWLEFAFDLGELASTERLEEEVQLGRKRVVLGNT